MVTYHKQDGLKRLLQDGLKRLLQDGLKRLLQVCVLVQTFSSKGDYRLVYVITLYTVCLAESLKLDTPSLFFIMYS